MKRDAIKLPVQITSERFLENKNGQAIKRQFKCKKKATKKCQAREHSCAEGVYLCTWSYTNIKSVPCVYAEVHATQFNACVYCIVLTLNYSVLKCWIVN